jgi:hypothetical protein
MTKAQLIKIINEFDDQMEIWIRDDEYWGAQPIRNVTLEEREDKTKIVVLASV